MAELVAGGPQVGMRGLRLRANGFTGVVEPANPAPGVRDRGDMRDGSGSLSARLVDAIRESPEGAFTVDERSEGVEVGGEVPTDRDGSSGSPVLHADTEVVAGFTPIGLSEDEDGFVSWTLPTNIDELRTGGESGVRSAEPLVAHFAIPMEVSPTRGPIGFVAKKLFRVVSAALFDRLLEEGGERLAQWMERDRPHRLRAFGPDDFQKRDVRGLEANDLTEMARHGRALLFIHGTNSFSDTGFHSLPQAYMRELWERYQRRVIAFDHPTLSADPAKNAAWFADQLPRGVGLDVDIISHSRGGLVARELVERSNEYELDGRLNVHSVAFVGTPNRGTPLCQPEHLAKYVDALTNVLSILPDVGLTDAIDAIVGSLSHIARKAYEGIPGAMAMNPKGDYLAKLNRGDDSSSSRYFGISVNFEPTETSGWQRRLRDVVFDQVFKKAPNDLIVPTESVWNGDRVGRRYELPKGAGVDHSTYWPNQLVRSQLDDWFKSDRGAPVTAIATPDDAARALAEVATSADSGPKGGRRESGANVDVEVVHGSLEHARYPVCVGHYQGAALEGGAEGYLDRRLGGTLSRRQVLGLYPEQEGYVIEIPVRGDKRPPGAYVVCLGAAEEFNATKLARVVTQAALYVLSREIETRESHSSNDESGHAELGLSTVLIGTSRPVGLSVARCVLSILEGIASANRHIGSLGSTSGDGTEPMPTITRVELLERDEDRAEVAARTLLTDPQVPQLGFRAAPAVREGEGGRTARASSDDRSLSWRTLEVGRARPSDRGRRARRAHPEAPLDLNYTLIGSRAGAPVTGHVVDKALLDSLLGDALQKPGADEQIQNTVFELLLPRDTKVELSTGGPVTLVVDDELANYPWEMLTPRGDPDTNMQRQPLCVQSGFLRRLRTPPSPRRRGAGGRRALVIGNPPVGAPLPGARDEALAVADFLTANGYQVTRCIFGVDGSPLPAPTEQQEDRDPILDPFADPNLDKDRYWTQIVHELFRDEYRIVHIAAHGRFDKDLPERSGAMIGRNTLLSSSIFASLPIVPDFVFFNCCHLGQMDQSHHGQIAASVAKTLMEGGVRAVVAAGWAVDDRHAGTFARCFYDQMLHGAPFGEAVHVARKNIYGDGQRRSSTWGAYQCYGDPGFRIAQAQNTDLGEELVLEKDIERRFRDLAASSGDVLRRSDPHTHRQKVAETLVALRTDAERLFWCGASTLVAYSKACAAVGNWREAVDSLQALLELPDGEYSLADVEQLANYEVRLAQSLFRKAPEDPEIPRLFEHAEERIAWLLMLKETPERLALEASFHKKRATTMSTREQRDEIRTAWNCYARAEALAQEPYQVLNRIQLEEILGMPPTDGLAKLDDFVVGDRNGTERSSIQQDYYARVASADADLTRALAEGKVGSGQEALQEAYWAIFDERSTWKERDSTIGHLWDLAQLVDENERAALLGLWDTLNREWQIDS